MEIPGLQPYLPLPQRKVGRLRGRVARLNKPSSQPATYRARDIREFFVKKTLAGDETVLQGPKEITQSTAFGGLQERRGGRKRRSPNDCPDEESRLVKNVDDEKMAPPQNPEEPNSEAAPPRCEEKNYAGINEEDILMTPRNKCLDTLPASKKRIRQEDVKEDHRAPKRMKDEVLFKNDKGGGV